MAIEVLVGRIPEPSAEEVIAAIQQKATTAAIAKDITDPNDNFRTVMCASTNGNRSSHRGGFRSRGRGGRQQPYRTYCNRCKMTNHNSKDYRRCE